PQGTDEHPVEPDIPPDRTRRFEHVNFSRMRTSWLQGDQIKVQQMGLEADRIMHRCFPEAYALMEWLYSIVREPEINIITDQPLRGPDLNIRWKRNDRGLLIEDWSRLGDRERSEILDRLVMNMFEWEQQVAVMWGSAMFAKGIWEETFADGYVTPRGSLTVDDRTQRGHLASIEERYFGIFESILSRRADALLRSMNRIYARLMKDER
ncbi:MAG: hypothetical protein ACREP9_11345, partial [Candidatus Dormibacteraceae bacterium]